MSGRYSPRPAPGRCRFSAECCRLLIEVSALTALELESRGEMSPFARDVLDLMGGDGERWLGTRSGLVVIEVPTAAGTSQQEGEIPPEERKEGKK